MNDPPGYPRELEREVVLRDGTRVRIRPIRPEDAPGLVAAYDRLSAHSAYQRFFSVRRRLPPDWAQFLATVDYRQRLASSRSGLMTAAWSSWAWRATSRATTTHPRSPS